MFWWSGFPRVLLLQPNPLKASSGADSNLRDSCAQTGAVGVTKWNGSVPVEQNVDALLHLQYDSEKEFPTPVCQ